MIPHFDPQSCVLPPHLGDPTREDQLTPYLTTTVELCNRFATNLQRVAILRGLLRFREVSTHFGITDGFQWLDGSFIENKEARFPGPPHFLDVGPPNDLDVVTFFRPSSDPAFYQGINDKFTAFVDPLESKRQYLLDHFPLDLSDTPEMLVEGTRYWSGLFSHQRNSGVWKGMLRIELNTPMDDITARSMLSVFPSTP
jgi:hypothetical protein